MLHRFRTYFLPTSLLYISILLSFLPASTSTPLNTLICRVILYLVFCRRRLSLCSRIAFSHSSRPSSPKLSHKKIVGPCSVPQNLVVPLPALGKKGGAVTADSPCSCTAENTDCRARSSLHVGDHIPAPRDVLVALLPFGLTRLAHWCSFPSLVASGCMHCS